MLFEQSEPKIAIGGIGGSGTRAVAEFFINSNLFMGYDLNKSNDNLLYTLLFKHKDILVLPKNLFEQRVKLFYKIMATSQHISKDEINLLNEVAFQGSKQHTENWLSERVKSISTSKRVLQKEWGWKEPNTHIIIDKFLELQSNLKFIYVYRNGLDMAYSSNQNQLQLWGEIFLNKDTMDINPRNSLKYWCSAHKRMKQLKKIYPKNIYMLNLDLLCVEYENEIVKLLSFLEIKSSTISDNNIFTLPSSFERHKKFSLNNFDNEDLKYVMDSLKC